MFGPKRERGFSSGAPRFPARPPSGRASRDAVKAKAESGSRVDEPGSTSSLARVPSSPSPSSPSTLMVNLSSCKYEAVRACARDAGYAEVGDEEEHWDLHWTDLSVSEHRVAKMLPFQRVNHFPGMMEICRKAALSRNLKRMQQASPKGAYDFAPMTWEYPNELESFRRYRRANPGHAYIVKPTAGAMGRGIYLVESETEIDHKHDQPVVIQKYVSNPLLIDGFKFDLRVYALVAHVDPLVVYVYDEGIARLATTAYVAPAAGNLREKTMHLTNYSVNKHSEGFVHADADDEGTKRAMSALFRDLERKGHDVGKLREQIADVVVRTVVSIQPHLAHAYHSAVTNGPKSAAERPPAPGGERRGTSSSSSGRRGASRGGGGSADRYAARGEGEGGIVGSVGTAGGAGSAAASSAAASGPSGSESGPRAPSRCFEVLGFDIILDENLTPTLLEVNHSPSFGTDSPLDLRVKRGLIGDVLKALALDAGERNVWRDAQKKRQRQRLYNHTAPTEGGRGLPGASSGEGPDAYSSGAAPVPSRGRSTMSSLGSTARSEGGGYAGGYEAAAAAAGAATARRPRAAEPGGSKQRRDPGGEPGGRPGSRAGGDRGAFSGRARTGAEEAEADGGPANGGATSSTKIGGGGATRSTGGGATPSTGGGLRASPRDWSSPSPPPRPPRPPPPPAARRPPGSMDPDAPPLRMGGFWRAHPHAGPTPAEAAATRAHGMSSPRVVAREALARTLAETAERFFQPVAGCACAACDARVVRDRLSYAVQHMKRVTVEGDEAPLDDRDDEFLSSFPFSRESPKTFAVSVGGGKSGGGAGEGTRPRETRTYTSLAGKAALNVRERNRRATRTFR